MRAPNHFRPFSSLAAALLMSVWNLGAQETNRDPLSAAQRAMRIPRSAPGDAKSSSGEARVNKAPISTPAMSHPELATKQSLLTQAPAKRSLPSAPPGVTDLKFGEIFKPVGPLGLEYSDKARSLDGKKVRILGYMVRQSEPVPWAFLLAPVPVTLHEKEYGLAEDMPATLVHVTTRRDATPIVPHTPGPLLLTGTLSIGNREEAGGRISSVRLALDPATPEQRAALNQLTRGQPAVPATSTSLSTNAAPE
jgi:hypothetical protein